MFMSLLSLDEQVLLKCYDSNNSFMGRLKLDIYNCDTLESQSLVYHCIFFGSSAAPMLRCQQLSCVFWGVPLKQLLVPEMHMFSSWQIDEDITPIVSYIFMP